MELVFATHNRNKVEEIRQVLPPHISIRTLEEIGCQEEIRETAETLEGNALLKASFVLEKYGYPCFADDTGLEVASLEGAPGVYSARYAGVPKDDRANMDKLLSEMKGKPDRRAQFTTVIALCFENEKLIFKGEVKGLITQMPRGDKGFGYDPVFQPEGYEKTFAELTLAEKNQVSHRARALAKLLAYLKQHFPENGMS
jgi:XTP/dITP diphosphohydrolase